LTNCNRIAIILSVCLTFIWSTTTESVEFGVAPYPAHGEQATTTDWIAMTNNLSDLKVNAMVVSHTWADLEPVPHQYQTASVASVFSADAKAGRIDLFGLKVIDTVARGLPTDLANTAWNSPDMLQRFTALVSQIAAQALAAPAFISVGNEADVYFQVHPSELAAFLIFYRQAATVLHQKFPGTEVGITVTYEGLAATRTQIVAKLLSASEVAIFTYYPLIELTLQPASAVDSHLSAIVKAASGRPVVLQELGYPSGTATGSSEAMQAAFFSNVLAGIKARPQIVFSSIFILGDFSANLCADYSAYYGYGDATPARQTQFQSYICSLGLRAWDGTPKEAWQTVLDTLSGR
jgi:hypothetical protein